MSNQDRVTLGHVTRRDFLAGAGTVGAASALLATTNFAYARAETKLKVGVIGCGGRGSGAAANCATSSENVEIYAMGDAFKDRLDSSLGNLKEALKDKVNVTEDRMFTG